MHYVILIFALYGFALIVENFLTTNDQMDRDCAEWPNLSDTDERLLP